MDRLPNEVIDLIGIYVQERHLYGFHWTTWLTPWFADNIRWKEEVMNLRLVNRQFNAVFSPLLFQRLEFHFDLGLYRCTKRLEDLVNLSRSNLCSHVESLVIKLESTYEDSPACLGTDKAINEFFEDFCDHLPPCIQAFHNIRYLDMISPHGAPNGYPEELIPVRYSDQINTALATIFTQNNLQHLEHLALRLPVAADFDAIMKYDVNPTSPQSRQPLREIFSRLSSLTLQICDNSGESGQRHFEKPDSMTKSGFFQQKRYGEAPFDIASLATAVDSLYITCTVLLDLDRLVVRERPSFNNLKNFAIYRVEASGEHLMRLLTEISTTVERINLHEVELKSQTWEQVFMQLCSFPLLYEADVLSCGYAVYGASYHFYADWPLIDETPQSLDSERFRDVRALYELMGVINPRREQRGMFTSGCQWYPRDTDGTRKTEGLSSFRGVPDPKDFLIPD